MSNIYHILNGDALKAQFPKTINGEIIVARECLVDGPVQADSLEKFFQLRAEFISELDETYSVEKYFSDSALELEKISAITADSQVYLWFEEDLFCQVNFWFVVHLLSQKAEASRIYLVRPPAHTPYGFGGLSKEELIKSFKNSISLSEVDKIAALWSAYAQNDATALLALARALPVYPFLLEAVEAHLARIPHNNYPGRPKAALLQIMEELGTRDFGPVFKVFHQREAIYGFGDVQVRRLWEELVADGSTD